MLDGTNILIFFIKNPGILILFDFNQAESEGLPTLTVFTPAIPLRGRLQRNQAAR